MVVQDVAEVDLAMAKRQQEEMLPFGAELKDLLSLVIALCALADLDRQLAEWHVEVNTKRPSRATDVERALVAGFPALEYGTPSKTTYRPLVLKLLEEDPAVITLEILRRAKLAGYTGSKRSATSPTAPTPRTCSSTKRSMIFTNEQGASLEIAENIYAMLLVEPFFQGFTKLPVCDAKKATEAPKKDAGTK